MTVVAHPSSSQLIKSALEKPQTPVRDMSREDRRIIFAKIDEHYIDEKEGYAAPHTDFSIAQNLGVPQAWVALIREENFGPAGSNSEIDKLLEEHQKLCKEVSSLKASLETMERHISAARGNLTVLLDRHKPLEAQVQKLLKAVGKA